MAKSKEQIEAVKQDYELTAMTLREIANKHKVSPATVLKWSRKYGWLRSKQELKKQTKKINKRSGRKRVVIDYQKLEGLCKIHCTGEECASILCIDYDTLNKNLKYDNHGGFTEYFKKASAGGKMSLRRKQYEVAESGNVTMLIWLGKQQLGQTDKAERYVEEKENEQDHSTEFTYKNN